MKPPGILTATLVVYVSLFNPGLGRLAAQPGRDAPTPVKTRPVQSLEVEEMLTFVGDIGAPRLSIVGSAVDGRVEEVLVEAGDMVAAGDVLVELRKRTVNIQLKAAEAELDLRVREHVELKNGSRPEEIAEAEAKFQQAVAQLDYAQKRFARIEGLRELGRAAATEQEFEEAQSQFNAAQESLNATRAATELVKIGPRPEKIAQAEARVEIARQEVARLEDLREKYTISAPFDGAIVAKRTEVGQWVSSAEVVIEVAELNPIEVRISLPEAYIGKVSVGQPVLIRAATIGRGAIPFLDPNSDAAKSSDFVLGEIFRIVPQADARSRSFPIIVRLENPIDKSAPVASVANNDGLNSPTTAADTSPQSSAVGEPQENESAEPAPKHSKMPNYQLLPGMIAQASMRVGDKRQALFVPKDAVVWNLRQATIFVAAPDPMTGDIMAKPLNVEVGLPQQDLIEVRDASGFLKAGQSVVTLGNERLRPGQKIKPVE